MPSTAPAVAAAAPPTAAQIQAAVLAGAQAILLPHDSGVQVFSNPSLGNPLQVSIRPRYVGLLRSFTMRIQMTFTAASAMTRTQFGASNLLSQYTFIDLNSTQRFGLSGRSLTALASMKRKRRINSVYLNDSPSGWNPGAGVNTVGSWGALVENCPATIAAGQTVTIAMTYELPVSYAYDDLRGSIFLNTVQAQLTVNGVVNTMGAFIAQGADPLNAVYTCAGTLPTIQSVIVDGLQDYLDQLPTVTNSNGSASVVLPLTQIAQLYNATEQTYAAALVAGADYPISFGDLRQYLSALVTFDNGGNYNYGSDLNWVALVSAGAYNYWKLNPSQIVKRTRDMIQCDLPAGQYVFSFRGDPISTNEYGNTRLVINPSAVAQGSALNVMFEYMSTSNTIAGSGVGGQS